MQKKTSAWIKLSVAAITMCAAIAVVPFASALTVNDLLHGSGQVLGASIKGDPQTLVSNKSLQLSISVDSVTGEPGSYAWGYSVKWNRTKDTAGSLRFREGSKVVYAINVGRQGQEFTDAIFVSGKRYNIEFYEKQEYKGVLLARKYFTVPTKMPKQIVACTQDAKLCADGSSVGRSGPSCEFKACPVEEKKKIKILSPTLEQTWMTGSEVEVKWAVASAGDYPKGMIQVVLMGNGTAGTIGTTQGSAMAAGAAKFTLDSLIQGDVVYTLKPGVYKLTLNLYDKAGCLGDCGYSFNFSDKPVLIGSSDPVLITITGGPLVQCKDMWWVDSTYATCSKSNFCSAHAYQGFKIPNIILKLVIRIYLIA